ncbi:YdcF family protein [Saccharibacillus kuerlensis]|uniref:Membrane protein n=1 Tax=Saccharibacillus kuerlensis TaxID=459527 RepID=A0ABQ2KWP2_9BACL|nr:YdcF family protein [Saccharibacillus kuerlensis]GGN95063.1 membrane protein [Saccharibacillus kuerlensis]
MNFLFTYGFYGISVLLLAAFVVSYLHDKRRIRVGMLLTSGLLMLALSLMITLIRIADESGTVRYAAILGAFAVVLLLPLLVVGTGAGLIYNARILWRKEGFKLNNLLTLALGLLIFLYLGLLVSSPLWTDHEELAMPILLMTAITGYLGFVFLCYLVSCVLYNLVRPKPPRDYIIVLGAGLKGDKVTPLLAGRLNRGIEFYRKQENLPYVPPIFVVSGGKGSDEMISEAAAMRNYLLEQGIPSEWIRMEDRSVNTLQNMAFSKQIMDAERGEGNYTCVFTTNNFHLFRAGVYARKAGLKAEGIGSKTAFYYLPNAFIREYIAILSMYRKWHISVIIAIVLMFGLAGLLLWWMDRSAGVGV